MKPIDIAVAGCGPAGMAAALLLAKQGHRVTIYERFVEPGPVGSGLMIQPTGLAVLDRLGLAAALTAAAATSARSRPRRPSTARPVGWIISPEPTGRGASKRS